MIVYAKEWHHSYLFLTSQEWQCPCRGQTFPFFLSRLFGCFNYYIDIKQINRMIKTNLISYIQKPQRHAAPWQSGNWGFYALLSFKGSGGLGRQRGGRQFTGRWKDQMFGKFFLCHTDKSLWCKKLFLVIASFLHPPQSKLF